MKKSLLIVIALLSIQNITLAQKDSLGEGYYIEADYKGFQIDVTSMIAINSIGFAFDIDMIKSLKDPAKSFGFRLGGEYCDKYTDLDFGGGSSDKAEFIDINLYPRVTSDIKTIRVDVYAGIAFHHVFENFKTSIEDAEKSDKIILKGGLDFKIKLYKNYVGLIGKIVLSTGNFMCGFGVFFGYGKEY